MLSSLEKVEINKTNIISKIKLLTSTTDLLYTALTSKSESGNSMFDVIEKMSDKNFYKKLKKYEDIVEQIADISKITIEDSGFTDTSLKNATNMVENYAKFVDNVNKVDLKKLETTTNMFKYMSEFSKSINGNFDDLTRAIAEQLMPMLQELKELLSDIPDKIQQSSSDISASMYHVSGGFNPSYTSWQANAEQVQREKPGISKEEVASIVDQRMADQTIARAQSVTTKIEELMDMLRTGEHRVTIHD
jgi:hypothetical protein